MDSISVKIGIFFGGIFIAKVLPDNSEKVFIFILGIFITIVAELMLLYLYIITKCRVFTQSAIQQESPIPQIESSNKIIQYFIRTPRKSVNRKFCERRMTMIQCSCTEENFELLLNGNDRIFIELANHLKEFINIQKKYANGLIKLGEIGLIEKIKSKKSMDNWRNFREFLFDIGEMILKELEVHSDDLIQNCNTIDKEIKKKYKQLGQELRTAGEKFYNGANEIQKLTKKLNSKQSEHKKVNSEYNNAKKDLAQFETLVKKEMKLKKATIDVSSLKKEISVLSEAMVIESNAYLPKAKEILNEIDHFDKYKATQYRNCFQLWLSYMLNIYILSYQRLEKLDKMQEEKKNNEGSGLQKTIDLLKLSLKKSDKTDDSLNFKAILSKFKSEESPASNMKRLDKKISKLEGYINDLLKFFNLLISNEEEYLNENMRILDNWHNISNPYLDDALTETKNKMTNIFLSIRDYKLQIFNILATFKEFIEEMKVFRKDIFQFQLTSVELEAGKNKIKEFYVKYGMIIEESKPCLLKSLKSLIDISIIELRSSIQFINNSEAENSQICSGFNHRAKTHVPECPYFVCEVENDDSVEKIIEEPTKIGEPESALWLNDFLNAFISEWRYSPRFNDYIRKRLEKIYNKDNPDYIGVIQIIDVEIGDKAPEIKDITMLDYNSDIAFYYEFDLWFRGDIKIHMEFPLKISVAEMTVSVKVILRSFYGKVRIFYTPSNIGCSWYSFISEPVHQISLEPIIGKMSKIALSKIPQVNSIIGSRLSKKLRKYVWPNKRSIKIFKGQKSSFLLD